MKNQGSRLSQWQTIILPVELRNLTRWMDDNFETFIGGAGASDLRIIPNDVELQSTMFAKPSSALWINIWISCVVTALKVPLGLGHFCSILEVVKSFKNSEIES